VAFVADGTEARLYRNGVEVGAAFYDGTLKTNRPGLGIGVKLSNNGSGPNAGVPAYWDGIIDDVRIWDWSLCQSEIESLHFDGVTDVVIGPTGAAFREFSLGQNHPNPFRAATEVAYAVPDPGHVTIAVYDIAGRRVVNLVDREQEAGAYVVRWHGRNQDGQIVAPGVYFYRMAAGDFTAVKKLIVLR
jgi:hypothetical protein